VIGSKLFVYGSFNDRSLALLLLLYYYKDDVTHFLQANYISCDWTGGIAPRKAVTVAIRKGQLSHHVVKHEYRRHGLDYAVNDMAVLDINTLVWERVS
jgi:hypothetical protein